MSPAAVRSNTVGPTVLRLIARMNVGGPAQEIVGLMRGIRPERYEQVLAVGRIDDGEEDWLTLRSPELAGDPRIVGVRSLGRPIAPAADLRAYREIRALVRRLRPALVHTHTAKAGLVGRLAALHEGVPVIHTFHGHVLHGYFGRSTSAAIRVAERRLAARSAALLAGGTQVRDDLLAAGVGLPSQYTVVPPGVVPPTRWDRSRARAELGLTAEEQVVAFVGRLAGIKRIDRFLAVAERLTRVRPGTVFLVAGGGEPEEVAVARRLVEQAQVRFLGWVGEVGRVYAAADLVLLTSDNEGMPVSLIEAGMCGLASVATDVGSVREVVLDGRTGLVVPPDAELLAAACLELLADDRRRLEFGDAAEAHTHASFGMARLVERTIAVYDAVVAGRPIL
jgi:glycosyltransferase involved in cell wall biosynthesis